MSKKKKEKYNINTVYHLTDELMKKMNIPKIDMIDGNQELWMFVKLDRHKEFIMQKKYMISTYGRVYNVEKNCLQKQHIGGRNTKFFYSGVTLSYNGVSANYLVHRLIAMTFFKPDEDRPFVNHKDGNPSHNYIWNLEWVNNSENILHAVKTGLKVDKRGENRSNALWTDNEIRMICEMIEDGHKATYIYHALGDILKDPKVEYERVRTLYKHIIHRTHWTHISKDYDIDFSAFNYKKEKGSVKSAKKKKEEKELDVIIFNSKRNNYI